MNSIESILMILGRASWQAGVLVVLVMAAQILFRRWLSPRWRCALWWLVALRLLLPVSLESSLSIFNALPRGAAANRTRAIAVQPAKSRASSMATTLVNSPTDHEIVSDANTQIESSRRSPSLPTQSAATELRSLPSPVSTNWPLIFFAVWITGVGVLGVQLLIATFRLHRRMAGLQPVNDPSVLDRLKSCQDQMMVRTRLPIFETDAVSSPALYGLFHPRLLLPRGFTANFSDQEQRFVFLHELAHVKRHDIVFNWLLAVLQIVHWFNPLLWLAAFRFRTDRELACDDLALDRAGAEQSEAYGQTILRLLQGFTHPATVPGLVGILEDKRQLRRRIAAIADFTPLKRGAGHAIGLLVALGAVALTDAQVDRTDNSAAPDPIYNGKPLSVWLEGYHVGMRTGRHIPDEAASSGTPIGRNEADDAVRHVGTNAVPLLLDLIRANDFTFTNSPTTQSQKDLKSNITTSSRSSLIWAQNWNGAMAFPILGKDAVFAVPALIEIYSQNISESSRGAAAYALGAIGPSAKGAIPVLAKGATNSTGSAKGNTIAALGLVSRDSSNAVPIFLHFLRDSDPRTRTPAAVALGYLGAHAKLAIPELKSALNDSDANVKMFADRALRSIDPSYQKAAAADFAPDPPLKADRDEMPPRSTNDQSTTIVVERAIPAGLKLPGDSDFHVPNQILLLMSWHTANRLPDGKVLVEGGLSRDPSKPNSALYDPSTGLWTATGAKRVVRYRYAASMLPDGKVLLTGGNGIENGRLVGSQPAAEIYDPATGRWTLTNPMNNKRMYHTATLLRTGKVLVAGGARRDPTGPSAELYDPTTGKWNATGEMKTSLFRYDHTATLLADGRVLVAGGLHSSKTLDSAEIYDPATGEWETPGSMKSERLLPTATLLPDGKVLVVGGSGGREPRSLLSAELFDPGTGKWTDVGAMKDLRPFHAAVLLPSGTVLVVTGGHSELYDPTTGKWSPTGVMTTSPGRPVSTLLGNGKVLVTDSGLLTADGSDAGKAELYDPTANAWSRVVIDVVADNKP